MIVTEFFTAETPGAQSFVEKFTSRFLCASLELAVKSYCASIAICTAFTFFSGVFPAQAQSDFPSRLSKASIELTNQKVYYDATYFSIKYPNGDVPANRGVCTDVVIRAYRKLGIDLQQKVHEDMKANFSLYPKIWGLKRTDTNIDHRRVPNLMTFFTRQGVKLKATQNGSDYKPGDIVTWDIGGNTPHIGIVIDQRSTDKLRPLIVHNIGGGQEISDCLFKYTITGHFRYPGSN